MKIITHIVITHAVFLAFFAVATIALAEETDGTSLDNAQVLSERQGELQQNMEGRGTQLEANQAENKVEQQDNIDERKENFQTNLEVRRAALQDRARERVTNLAANISNRMETVIDRIQNIIDRTDSRIEKMSQRGFETTTAEMALASAQMSLDAAIADITNIDNDVATAVSSEDVHTSWTPVKNRYLGIRDNLKTAHSELRATVTALKEAGPATQNGNTEIDQIQAQQVGEESN